MIILFFHLVFAYVLRTNVCCFGCLCFFFFKQKTAYEMRISDWSSDVCSSDLDRSTGAKGGRTPGLKTVQDGSPTTATPHPALPFPPRHRREHRQSYPQTPPPVTDRKRVW